MQREHISCSARHNRTINQVIKGILTLYIIWYILDLYANRKEIIMIIHITLILSCGRGGPLGAPMPPGDGAGSGFGGDSD